MSSQILAGAKVLRLTFKSRMGFFRHSEALTPKARRARRALAAALAIQTMRKQGTLPSRAATV